MKEDLLVEIQTEELPPKSLLKVSNAFKKEMQAGLARSDLSFESIASYVTPRRLALIVKNLISQQGDQFIERKGPALAAAYDAQDQPTKACLGFAKSCGITPEQLIEIKTEQGAWVGYRQTVPGKSLAEIIPSLLETIVNVLPVSKRMRWAESEIEFIRPVHSIILLYGDQVIPATLLGCKTDRITTGHRFMGKKEIVIKHAKEYLSALKSEGFVLVDFNERQNEIKVGANQSVQEIESAHVLLKDQALLDEVTGLVEWPISMCGQFDKNFLDLPQEVLISSMKDHQRYFPVLNAAGELLPYFVTVSNLKSEQPARVQHGNERVLRARLADADFFYQTDKHETLAARLPRLKKIVFQAKLGSLYDKSERLSQLADYIVSQTTKINSVQAKRAGLLAKTDLTTHMVNEFPELQGVMGYYYAKSDQEEDAVALAIKEHYLPRYAGDALPKSNVGQALAIADRIDTLVGNFGLGQLPTGDKDPFGLRRAALGILRILIENEINLDLKALIDFTVHCYQVSFENQTLVADLLNFFQERLRAWYQEQGVPMDVFAAVSALKITDPFDAHKRILAVSAFKKLTEAATLSIANKRVSNILSKYTENLDAQVVNPDFFEHAAEKELARQLNQKEQTIASLYAANKYDEVLLSLAELRVPIDNFFDHVMVMTENKTQRENRILLLSQLRALFLQVADIALLQ